MPTRQLWMLLALLAGLLGYGQQDGAVPGKPNIVFIFADDLGYGDVHCLNPERGKIATPNMDRLAARGMTFTDAHSSSAVCTPSRYSVLTGRYNWRSTLQKGVFGGTSSPLIGEKQLTVGKLLQQQGYATACIGKWHLGMEMPKPITEGTIAQGPTTRGFDYYFGISASLDMPPYAYIENDRFTEPPSETRELYAGRKGPAAPSFECVDVLATLVKKSQDWIAGHKDKPFLLYMPLTSPHTPLAPTKEWQGKSGLGDYGDFVMETDWAIGEVVGALEAAGIAENTLVLLSSDNGCAPYIGTSVTTPKDSNQGMGAIKTLEAKGHFSSGDFRGYKSDAWEGGHRVPFFAVWPAVIKPGTKSSQPVCLVDFTATCAAVSGATIPDDAAPDSFSLLPLFQGKEEAARAPVVHHSISGNFAIRDGKWKLVACSGSGGWSDRIIGDDEKKLLKDDVQLYDMSQDAGERHNLQAEHPEVAQRLMEKLKKIVDEGRSTPGQALTNDAPVNILKKGK